jgi:hypothetical protein
MANSHRRSGRTIDPHTLAAILRDQITEEEGLCRGGDDAEEWALNAIAAKRLAFADAISTMTAEELIVTLHVDVRFGDRSLGGVELTPDMKLLDFFILANFASPRFSGRDPDGEDHGGVDPESA